jgi:protein-S-isoprenylcysteine O-methyltransferase Ste14
VWIIRIFLIIIFGIFGYNLVFIINTKRKNNLPKEAAKKMELTQRKTIAPKIGIVTLNIFITLSCLNIFFYSSFLKFIPRFSFPLISEPLQIIGFIFAVSGNITLNFSYRELGIYWEYPIDGKKEKRKLVKTGIYSQIRHPIYLSFYLICGGMFLILLDVILLVLFAFGSIGLYLQALEEEKELFSYFGQEYKEYKETTGRFFAKIKIIDKTE